MRKSSPRKPEEPTAQQVGNFLTSDYLSVSVLISLTFAHTTRALTLSQWVVDVKTEEREEMFVALPFSLPFGEMDIAFITLR